MIREHTKRFGIAALMGTLVLSASFGGAAIAQDRVGLNTPQAPITQTAPTKPTGKPVILRIGRDFNPIAADRVADLLIEEGCPTEVTNEGGRYKRLTVEIDGEGFKFKQPGSAAAAALKWCLERP